MRILEKVDSVEEVGDWKVLSETFDILLFHK